VNKEKGKAIKEICYWRKDKRNKKLAYSLPRVALMNFNPGNQG
jgi:hypothetical protein